MTDRVAIVTGGAQGIGLGIAKRLLDNGCRVSVWDLDEGAMAGLAQELGVSEDRLFVQKVNVTSKDEVFQAVEDLTKHWKVPDILVNNAGIARDKRLIKMEEEDWDVVLDVNLKSMFLCCKAVATGMIEAGYGRIVNISSRAWLGGFGQVNYSASKGGAVSLTRTLALELASKGITVNAIAPGLVDTPLLRSYPEETQAKLAKSVPIGRVGDIDDIAKAVAFLSDEDSSYITGQLLYVCGGRSLSSPSV